MAKNKITRVSAYGIVTQQNRILLCRLSAMVPWVQGQWTLPGGGIEFGEDPTDTVVREVREETGLVVRPRGLAGVDSLISENDHQHFHNVRIIYQTELLGGELRFEQQGSTDFCQWLTLEEASKLPLVQLGKVGLQIFSNSNA